MHSISKLLTLLSVVGSALSIAMPAADNEGNSFYIRQLTHQNANHVSANLAARDISIIISDSKISTPVHSQAGT